MTDKEKLDKIIADIKRLKAYYEMLEEIKPVYDIAIGMADDLLEFIDSLQEEPASKELDIAIGEYCSNPDNFITYIDVASSHRSEQKDDIPLIIKAIEFGANWKEQQMMKDAYDAYVSYIRDNSEAVVYLNNTSVTMPSHFPKRDFDEGDKLKVIAIKED